MPACQSSGRPKELTRPMICQPARAQEDRKNLHVQWYASLPELRKTVETDMCKLVSELPYSRRSSSSKTHREVCANEQMRSKTFIYYILHSVKSSKKKCTDKVTLVSDTHCAVAERFKKKRSSLEKNWGRQERRPCREYDRRRQVAVRICRAADTDWSTPNCEPRFAGTLLPTAAVCLETTSLATRLKCRSLHCLDLKFLSHIPTYLTSMDCIWDGFGRAIRSPE